MIAPKPTPLPSPVPTADLYIRTATLLTIQDGDTIHCAVDMGCDLTLNMDMRLYGLNAAEHGTPGGDAATAWLKSKLKPGLKIVIVTHKDQTEKYGRYLASVWRAGDKLSINDQEIAAGYAAPWNGQGPRPVPPWPIPIPTKGNAVQTSMQPRKIARYGWKPDLPDARDHLYSLTAPKHLPSKIDLRPTCSPVEDQGNLGSCTGNAIVGALEYLQRKAGVTPVNLSRLFVYYNERVIEKTVTQDAGAEIRDGVKSLTKLGVCAETLCPYVVSKFTQKPTPKAYVDGTTRKVSEYQRVTSLATLRSCLADGYPVVFGFTVYESFESDAVAKSGVLQMPAQGEGVVGGHAVLAVGYDDAQERIIVRNSWGKSWGTAGYFTMPYAYVTNRSLSDDYWTLRK